MRYCELLVKSIYELILRISSAQTSSVRGDAVRSYAILGLAFENINTAIETCSKICPSGLHPVEIFKLQALRVAMLELDRKLHELVPDLWPKRTTNSAPLQTIPLFG